MGKKVLTYIDTPSVLCCHSCGAHIVSMSNLISRRFRGSSGPSFLMRNAQNISKGMKYQRKMSTGLHIIKDIFCIKCDHYLGWKYVLIYFLIFFWKYYAFEESEKYKVGNYIMEIAYLDEKFVD